MVTYGHIQKNLLPLPKKSQEYGQYERFFSVYAHNKALNMLKAHENDQNWAVRKIFFCIFPQQVTSSWD